jgi:hypothetical protein
MPRRYRCAGQGSATLVEVNEGRRHGILPPRAEAFHELERPSSRPQTLDFERQKRHLIDRIDPPEVAIEFERVYDAHRGAQVHVLRAQVTVTVDEAIRSFHEQSPTALQEFELGSCRRFDEVVAEGAASTAQRATVRDDFVVKPLDIATATHRPVLGQGIEPREHGDETFDFTRAQVAPAQLPIEHRSGRQPAHLHQPIDHTTWTRERESAIAFRQWQDREVHAWRQTPVELQLQPAASLPRTEGPVIDQVVVQGFLQLVSVASDQEHPRKVRFDGADAPRPPRITRGPPQELDLEVKSLRVLPDHVDGPVLRP